MLLKPTVPLGPVIVKDTVAVLCDWFDVIVALEICELVTFPLIARSTVASLPVVVGTVVANGLGVGEGFGVGGVVGLGVGVGAGVGVVVAEGGGVGVGANVAEMVFEA